MMYLPYGYRSACLDTGTTRLKATVTLTSSYVKQSDSAFAGKEYPHPSIRRRACLIPKDSDMTVVKICAMIEKSAQGHVIP
jgi:hypothetical protein